MPPRIALIAAVLCAASQAVAVTSRFQDAVKARIEGGRVIVLYADGSRGLVPLASIDPADQAWLTDLSQRSPLTRGKSQVTVVKETSGVKAKKTVEVAKIEGPVETVQLCQPSVMRDQLGGTCMLYARVHWLDIAGYYVDLPAIYQIINNTPPDQPWQSRHYVEGLTTIITSRKPRPVLHPLPPAVDAFEWVRQELRQGRPVLGAFPREVWQALPPGVVAVHPWSGGSVGHQIVINGFTWNRETRQGTFHVINSWAELPQFDLTTEAAQGGTLVIEQSLSPIGEPQPDAVKEVVQAVTLIKAVGTSNLYEVQTNLGTRRVVAIDAAAARDLVEKGP